MHTEENLLTNRTILVRAKIKDSYQTHARIRIPFDATRFDILRKVFKKSLSVIKPKSLRENDVIDHFILIRKKKMTKFRIQSIKALSLIPQNRKSFFF